MAEDVGRQQPIPQENDDLRDPLRRDIEDQLGTRAVEQVDWLRPIMRWIERTIAGMAWRPSDGLASAVGWLVVR